MTRAATVAALYLAGWALAVPAIAQEPAGEDTTNTPRYRVKDPILSTAPEMTLREIIERSVEGEKSKLAGRRDVTYNLSIRSIVSWERKREIEEMILLVYEDDEGFQKFIVLGEKKRKQKYTDQWEEVEVSDEEPEFRVGIERGSDTFASVPFFLEEQQEYEFELLERILEGETVYFKIGFRPRSSFKPLPSGTVYIDATHFRVIHEEFTFEENPAPVFLKGIDRISRHWEELPGGQWVPSKIMAELTLRSFFGLVPDRVDVVVLFNDFRFDQGYDEVRFGPKDAK